MFEQYAERMQAERVIPATGRLSFQLECGHVSHPTWEQENVCAYCADSSSAHRLHELLERQERELERRRARYPWAVASA